MKNFLVFAAVLAAGFTGYSQSTGNDAMESQIQRGLLDSRNRQVITMQTEKANEVRRGSVSYSGILVQFVKSDNKVQLINPAAPPQYGFGGDNLVTDTNPAIKNHSRGGLNFFSIRF